MTTQFDTIQHHLLSNQKNYRQLFNNLIIYKNCEIEAISEKLNGLYEFGTVLDYEKNGSNITLKIEFCGDSGAWIEFVDIKKCKQVNKFALYGLQTY